MAEDSNDDLSQLGFLSGLSLYEVLEIDHRGQQYQGHTTCRQQSNEVPAK